LAYNKGTLFLNKKYKKNYVKLVILRKTQKKYIYSVKYVSYILKFVISAVNKIIKYLVNVVGCLIWNCGETHSKKW